MIITMKKLMALSIVFISSVSWAQDLISTQKMTMPYESSWSVETETTGRNQSEPDTLVLSVTEEPTESLIVTHLASLERVFSEADQLELAKGVYSSASKSYRMKSVPVYQSHKWGQWNVYQFQSETDASGEMQKADAFVMVSTSDTKTDIVFAVNLFGDARLAPEQRQLEVKLRELTLNK